MKTKKKLRPRVWLVAIMRRDTKPGAHRNRKKELSKKICREKVREEK